MQFRSPSDSFSNRCAAQPRRGVVLLAVLVVVVLLSLAAYQYSELMVMEFQAAETCQRAAQARALADSGVHYAAALLADKEYFKGANGNPFDNPQAFQARPVRESDDARYQGKFSVVAPLVTQSDTANYRYGVVDEAGKINLNALLQFDSSGKVAHDILLQLPNMTEEIANAIVDWIDTDDTPRTGGAEGDYYSGLNPPYRAKNGPIESIEELLLVRGVTPELLFGADRNRNGLIDAEEQNADTQGLGWSAYLTFFGREMNVDADGNPRVYINDSDMNALAAKLGPAVGPDLGNYILAYRLYGPASSKSSKGGSGGGALTQGQLDLKRKARSIGSLFELINTSVSIPNSDPKLPPVLYPSPLNSAAKRGQLLPLLLDKTTTIRDPEIPGRVNVNSAPEAVLKALPGMNASDLQTILSHRPAVTAETAADATYQTIAWLITEANIRPETMRALERYLTARSQVYRVQVVGYFEGGGPAARVEAVIDTNAGKPRIVYYRDLSELGKGFPTGTQAP